MIRGVEAIADADVAALYGVDTKYVNRAVRNNPDKFPPQYMFELNTNELRDLRCKISSTNVSLMNSLKEEAEHENEENRVYLWLLYSVPGLNRYFGNKIL